MKPIFEIGCPTDPRCRHVRILDEAGKETLEITTLDVLLGIDPVPPPSLTEQATTFTLNATPSEVATTAALKTYLQAKTFIGPSAVALPIEEGTV